MSYVFDNLRKSILSDLGNSEQSLAAALNCSSIRNIFIDRYKKVTPLESLDPQEKESLWSDIKRLMPGKSREERIEGCKVLCVIGDMI